MINELNKNIKALKIKTLFPVLTVFISARERSFQSGYQTSGINVCVFAKVINCMFWMRRSEQPSRNRQFSAPISRF